jgi:hypothetical protein
MNPALSSERKSSRRALSESLNGSAKQTPIRLHLFPTENKNREAQEGVDPPGG